MLGAIFCTNNLKNGKIYMIEISNLEDAYNTLNTCYLDFKANQNSSQINLKIDSQIFVEYIASEFKKINLIRKFKKINLKSKCNKQI